MIDNLFFSLARRARFAGGLVCALCLSAVRVDADTPPASIDGREWSLAELLGFAERHAAAIQVATERRAYGSAARVAAEPALASNPTLEFAIGPRFAGPYTAVDFLVSLAQPVEVAGQRGLRRAAAAELGRRLDAEAAAVRWRVRHDVSRAFYAAVVAREGVTYAERALRFAEEVLEITQRRLAAGDATAIDLGLSETEVAEARQSLLVAERDSMSARLELCVATGASLDSPPAVPLGLAPPRPVPPLSELFVAFQERHPELRLKRVASHEARARVELADREAWPTPVFGVHFVREGSVGSPANDIVLGSLELPLPLWQQNQGERARSRAEEAILRAEEALEARALRASIARAHGEVTAALARVELGASSLTRSLSGNLELLERGFKAGEIPLIDVMTARRRFLEAERTGLEAYADYYRALADLESAIGSELPEAGGPPARDVAAPVGGAK